MSRSVTPIRDFVLQMERSLRSRRLYEPGSPPYEQAMDKLYDSLRQACQQGEFDLQVTAFEVLWAKQSLLQAKQREEMLFFGLYRDGLRGLSFTPETTKEELELFLQVVEADTKGTISPSEDTITMLWQQDLHGIVFQAVDGIADTEEDPDAPEGADEYAALVAELMSAIKRPASPEAGQSYALFVDADVKISQEDFHYQATTQRQSFEELPTVLALTRADISELGGELKLLDEERLLQRFIDILFFLFADPTQEVMFERAAPVVQRLLDGFWDAGELKKLTQLLRQLERAAEQSPLPQNRKAAQGITQEFLTLERFQTSLELLVDEAVDTKQVFALWERFDEHIWDPLIAFFAELRNDRLEVSLRRYLEHRLSYQPELLKRTLSSALAPIVHVGLSLLDANEVRKYEPELFALAEHPDESVRLRGIAAAGQLGGVKGLKVLLTAMADDPSKAVRLRAFRVAESASSPQLQAQLRAIVSGATFFSRPMWEKTKYVQLLARLGDERLCDLFGGWIPQKKWRWGKAEKEAAELAFTGLLTLGGQGMRKVRELAAGRGKVAELARNALEASRDEHLDSRVRDPRS